MSGFRPVVEWSPQGVRAVVSPGSVVASASFEALREQLPPQGIVLALSRRTVFVKLLRVPNVGAAEVGRILQVQAAQVFPLPMDELAYAFQLTSDVSAEGKLAVLTGVRAETLRRALAEAKSAGYKVQQITVAAQGSVRLLGTHSVADGAVVSGAGDLLSIDIIQDGGLRYSREISRSTPADVLATEISRTFVSAGVSPTEVFVAGGVSAEGARKLEGDPLLALAGATDLGPKLELPEEAARRAKEQVSARARFAVLLCLAALACGALVWADRQDKLSNLKRGEATWIREQRRLKGIHDSAVAASNKSSAMKTALQTVFEPKQPIGDVILVVSSKTPKGLWLTGFTLERGKPMNLRGTAKNNDAVAEFLQALSQTERFRDVKLTFANNAKIEDTPVVNFAMSAHVIGNFPMSDSNKLNRRPAAR